MGSNAVFVIGFWLLFSMAISFAAGFGAGRAYDEQRRVEKVSRNMRRVSQKHRRYPKGNGR